jgi:conserved hypothetical protein TIGR00043
VSEQQIHIQRKVRDAEVPAPSRLRSYARAALGDARGELTLRVVDEAESAELNGRFRGKPVPTNVLSFHYDAEPLEGAPQVEVLGDLVLCAPVIAREAAEQGKPPTAHWAHMVVHGVLHLLGQDHHGDDEAAHMEQCERAILASLGFPDPYL